MSHLVFHRMKFQASTIAGAQAQGNVQKEVEQIHKDRRYGGQMGLPAE